MPALRRVVFSPSVTKSRTNSRNRRRGLRLTLIKSTVSSGPGLAYSITAGGKEPPIAGYGDLVMSEPQVDVGQRREK